MKAYVLTELEGDTVERRRSDNLQVFNMAAEDDGVVVKIAIPGEGTLVVTCLLAAGLASVTYSVTMEPCAAIGDHGYDTAGDIVAELLAGTIGTDPA